MFFKFKIKIFKFIFKVFLINSETGNTEVYLILNTLLIIFLIETIHFNKNKIF